MCVCRVVLCCFVLVWCGFVCGSCALHEAAKRSVQASVGKTYADFENSLNSWLNNLMSEKNKNMSGDAIDRAGRDPSSSSFSEPEPEDAVSVLFCCVVLCCVLFCSVLFCSALLCSVLFCSVLFTRASALTDTPDAETNPPCVEGRSCMMIFFFVSSCWKKEVLKIWIMCLARPSPVEVFDGLCQCLRLTSARHLSLAPWLQL